MKSAESSDNERSRYFAGMLSKLPDDWIRHLPINLPLTSIPIVPFKVPVRCAHLSAKDKFNFDDLFNIINRRFNSNLIHVIDLTQSDRFYMPEYELANRGIGYTKIKSVGGQAGLPSEYNYRKFANTIDEQLNKIRAQQCQTNDSRSLIGVHCTHGRNRTGYLICRYLIQKLGMTPTAAIDEFENARGIKIERDHVKQKLMSLDDWR